VTVRLVLGILVGVIVALRLAQRAIARRQRALRAGGGHRCPSCGAERLVITEAIALAGEIDLEAIACRRCDLRGVAVRRATEHRGYPIDPIAWGSLSAALRRCPAPRDRGCACPTHARYGARPLDEVPHDAAASFDLE
jgi:hypothetical protein